MRHTLKEMAFVLVYPINTLKILFVKLCLYTVLSSAGFYQVRGLSETQKGEPLGPPFLLSYEDALSSA